MPPANFCPVSIYVRSIVSLAVVFTNVKFFTIVVAYLFLTSNLQHSYYLYLVAKQTNHRNEMVQGCRYPKMGAPKVLIKILKIIWILVCLI